MAVVECKAFAVVDSGSVVELAQVLRGLCSRYEHVKISETALTVPLQAGTKETVVKLVVRAAKELHGPGAAWGRDPPPERVLLQHEGLPLRGGAAADLPAAVREVYETYCQGPGQVQFWQALGSKFNQEVVKDGNEYMCHCEGHDLKVFLFRASFKTPGQPSTLAERYILEVVSRVSEGHHLPACRAIGIFSQKLAPLVTLVPAAIRAS